FVVDCTARATQGAGEAWGVGSGFWRRRVGAIGDSIGGCAESRGSLCSGCKGRKGGGGGGFWRSRGQRGEDGTGAGDSASDGRTRGGCGFGTDRSAIDDAASGAVAGPTRPCGVGGHY